MEQSIYFNLQGLIFAQSGAATFNLVSYTLASIFLIAKVKQRLDMSTSVTVLSFFLCFLIRFLNYVMLVIGTDGLQSVKDLNVDFFFFFDALSKFFVTICLLFFMFEMLLVKALLLANNKNEIQQSQTFINKVRIFILIGYVVLQITSQVFVFIAQFKKEPIYGATNKLLDLITFVFSAVLMFHCVRYFIDRKKQLIKRYQQEFTLKNKFIVIWIHFLFIFSITSSFFQNIGSMTASCLIHFDPNNPSLPGLSFATLIVELMVEPMEDFAIAMTIIYLFYHQALIANQSPYSRQETKYVFGRRNQNTMSLQKILQPASMMETSNKSSINSRGHLAENVVYRSSQTNQLVLQRRTLKDS